MKKAIITGARSGLGFEVAQQLKDNNVKVVNISRRESPFEDIQCDLSSKEDIRKTIENIREHHNDIDTLILNAGIMPISKVGEIDFDIDKTFEVNVTSNLHLLNGLMDLIKKNKGDIVIVGSVCAFKPYHGETVYSSTKFAIRGMIENLQFELKDEDVRVIGFHPGGFNSDLRGEDFHDAKLMNPKDVAAFLISTLKLPRDIQVSEVILRRKSVKK